MNKRIVIECHGNGTMKIEAIGFQGNACQKATEAIERALGADITGRKKKPEFFQQQSQGQKAGH